MPSTEHQAIAELMWAMRAASPPEGLSLEEGRANLDALGDSMPMPDGVEVTAVDAGGVPSAWFEAAGGDGDRGVLYLHGGAYTRGSIRSHGPMCGKLAVATGARVLGVDYRLAPEHPYPAAVDDALAAYRWLLGQGLDAERVAVAGDSAGGGLTAALLLAAREAGAPAPAGAVLLSPWTDLTLSGASMDRRAAEDPLCSRETLVPSAAAYAGAEDRACPLVSPLFGDLAGLPPLLVLVGTAEVLLDDSLRFAAAADAAGVDVTLVVEDDLLHVWPLFPGVPEADAAVGTIGQWVRKRTGA
jgi:epsilon-lactone hydrolase